MIAELNPLYIKTRPGKAIVRMVSHLFFQGRFLTTGHRWLNPFLHAEMKLIASLPQLKAVVKPIYIIGMGRSGSTILGKVLSMHREVGFLNEPKVIWYAVDHREDVNGHFSSAPAQYRFSAHDATPDMRKRLERIYAFYLAVTGSARIVDKNPELVFRVPYVREFFPNAHFIFLTRNGWDSIYSTAAWSRRAGRQVDGVMEDWWGLDRRKWKIMVEELVASDPDLSKHKAEIAAFTRHEDLAAVEWIVSMREGLRWLNSLPESVYLIRYEDLTGDPANSLPALLDFCKLSQDRVFLDYAQKTLVAGRTHNAENILPSCVKPAFLETMSALGYSPKGK